MEKDLKKLKEDILKLSENEMIERDLDLRRKNLKEMRDQLTGYPSFDKPWLRYYKDDYILSKIPQMSAYDYLKMVNQNNLQTMAIENEMGNYTYKELFEMIDRTASSLYQLGTKKGEIVLTMLPVAPHETFLLYGVDAVGAAISYLPPYASVEDMCDSINMFETETFFIFDFLLTPEMEKTIYEKTKLKHIISIYKDPRKQYDSRTISWDDFLNLGKDHQFPKIDRNPSDLLFIAKTGGSTGIPKNVQLSDNCFNGIVHQFINSDVNYNPGDRWLRLFALFSATAAVNNHHLPLCCGMTNVLRQVPMAEMKDFDQMIIKEKPNHIIMIPQLMDVLEKSKALEGVDLSFIKTGGCGGLSITRQFEERVNRFYKNHNVNTFLGYGWGCTEHSSNIAMRSNFETTIIGTVGAPMVKTIVATFDPDTLEELPYNTEGELCVSSPTLMLGYFNDSEMTKEVIKTHPDGSVWLHTKDLGTISEKGIVKVTGRMTRMIFTYPCDKVYPSTLESQISKVPGVREVCVCSKKDDQHIDCAVPMCFIVAEENENPQDVIDRVNQFCRENFPVHARPRKVFARPFMPLTQVGKIDVRALEYELETTLLLSREKAN